MKEILKLLLAALAGAISLIVIVRRKEPECPN